MIDVDVNQTGLIKDLIVQGGDPSGRAEEKIFPMKSRRARTLIPVNKLSIII